MLLERLKAITPHEKIQILREFVHRVVSHVLGNESDSIVKDRPIIELGLDSLMAFELRNRIMRDLGIDVPMTKLVSSPTISEIATALCEQVDATSEKEAELMTQMPFAENANEPSASDCEPDKVPLSDDLWEEGEL